MFDEGKFLLENDPSDDERAEIFLRQIGFESPLLARDRIKDLWQSEDDKTIFSASLPSLLTALSETANPDRCLVNFERYVEISPNRSSLFSYLEKNPQAIEILFRLFVGSQFLTEVLLRNPNYLYRLTQHQSLAEFKSRGRLLSAVRAEAGLSSQIAEKIEAIRRFHHWELLRIGACDTFGLMDLKTVTLQLSFLAESLVQVVLEILAVERNLPLDRFVVLALGKLGGRELNYSSDIDLVFLTEGNAKPFWSLGQSLISSLTESTGRGFLYRVDMRLRPWGNSGALVNSTATHLQYLRDHSLLWEKQALLKARPIAGHLDLGSEFLKQATPLVFENVDVPIREEVAAMKNRIEEKLALSGTNWGEVKLGIGSIRDVEFVTQFLQLRHGKDHPQLRSQNTLEAMKRLAELELVSGSEFRQLESGYVFLRHIEHSLQLMHDRQIHTLPQDKREQAYLARRLAYPDVKTFLDRYEQHCTAIRTIFHRHLLQDEATLGDPEDPHLFIHLKHMRPVYAETFSEDEIRHHAKLLAHLEDRLVLVDAQNETDTEWTVTVVGENERGQLSLMCGLFLVYGFGVTQGHVFTAEQVSEHHNREKETKSAREFIDTFRLHSVAKSDSKINWKEFESDLRNLFHDLRSDRRLEIHGQLAIRASQALQQFSRSTPILYPVEIEIDNDSSAYATVLHLKARDTVGFLYELTNALALQEIEVERVDIQSVGSRVFDSLYVTSSVGKKIDDPEKLKELRTAIVLIKHFTHLLPRSPNPESALLHFRDFLAQLFRQSNWRDDISSLQDRTVLDAMARVLGMSDFLWEDFLRLQYDNLFPVLKDLQSIETRKEFPQLDDELRQSLDAIDDRNEEKLRLNSFKDREMFRIDMRFILGRIQEFGQFSNELSDLADCVVSRALAICQKQLEAKYGVPLLDNGNPCGLAVCALGKCGGRELGFASDIELMFVFEDRGKTSGPKTISNTEYFSKLVEIFRKLIVSQREGIFEIDLRLRPYGQSGSLAVSLGTFCDYFKAEGPAWPYERQALVKLRPVAGNQEFGQTVCHLRDRLVYDKPVYDRVAMKAIREKQIMQLVQAGTFNAKLSPGGLADCEYLVQGLQLQHGKNHPEIRLTNTREAMTALFNAKILGREQYQKLRTAHVFLRKLIDALRMVRGNAKDLAVPATHSEEFEFLSRRLHFGTDFQSLAKKIELYADDVRSLSALLDEREPMEYDSF